MYHTGMAELVGLYLCPKEARQIAKEKNKRSRNYEYFVRTKTAKGGV